MKTIYQPLKDNWHIDEDKGFVPDQIQSRVDSEAFVNNCKGYPATEKEDIISVLCPRVERLII